MRDMAYVAVVNPGESLVRATSISLSETNLSLNVGDYVRLYATVSPSNATVKDVTWRSADTSIADVTTFGRVEAIHAGVTHIYAEAMDGSGVVAECKVTVKGYYYIVNPKTNKVVNISGSYLLDLSNDTNITLYSKSGSNEQIWCIDPISNQNYYVRSYIDENFGFNAYRYPNNNYNCNIHEIQGNTTDAAVRFVLKENNCCKIELANYPGYFLTATGETNESDIRWQTADKGELQIWRLDAVDLDERQNNIEAITNNIQNCSVNIIPNNRKTSAIAIAKAMLNVGYPVAFVSGMLSNIVYEGSTGEFENSNYVSNPNNKPDYLVYMDTEYNGINFYLNNYSGKTIMEVGVSSTYTMLCDLENGSNNTWSINGSRVGFGLGCLQWTFARTMKLVQTYREINNYSNNITLEQAAQAEAKMILRELSSSEFNGIISNWKNSCGNNIDSENAANTAGRILCQNYLRPSDPNGTKASQRAARAASIYSAITGS